MQFLREYLFDRMAMLLVSAYPNMDSVYRTSRKCLLLRLNI